MARSIFEAYNGTKKALQEAGIEDYGFEARQMIRRVTGYTSNQILEHWQQPLSAFQENNLTAMIHQRAIRYPLQYMFGEWSFYGRDFSVGTGVLIPRQDTEVLVETALKELTDIPEPTVLDLCAGTGCIGITVGLERQDAAVTLVEKYPQPMAYIEKNIKRHGAENVRALNGDVLAGCGNDGMYDLIVSNPPYIPDDEMATVSPEVHFEPEEALRGGADGLTFYRAIAKQYADAVKSGGKMMFEVGIHEAQAVSEILREAGFTDISVQKDYGGTDRVVYGTKY